MASGAILAGSQTLGKTKKGGKNAQRHSAGNIDLDNVDSDSTPQGAGQPGTFRGRSKTVSDGHEEHHIGDKVKGEFDPGTKSEGEDDSQGVAGTAAPAAGAPGASRVGKSGTLGRTPNHLTLSTTSTLSAGSTGSQARLIQSSQHPENYQPPLVKDLGSPVWKPRDMVGFGEATTLPRKSKPSTSSDGSRVVYEEFPSATLRSTRSQK